MSLSSLLSHRNLRRRSSIPRGMIFAEVIVTLGLFLVMIIAVGQLQMARLKAQRQLDREARIVARAHNLLEQVMAVPLATLREYPGKERMADLLEAFPTDPILGKAADTWHLELTELSSPLSGLRIVVRHQPADDDPARRIPIQLVAWRYDRADDDGDSDRLEEAPES